MGQLFDLNAPLAPYSRSRRAHDGEDLPFACQDRRAPSASPAVAIESSSLAERHPAKDVSLGGILRVGLAAIDGHDAIVEWRARMFNELAVLRCLKVCRPAVDLTGMTDLERTNAELRAALIIAGKRIVKLNFGKRDDPRPAGASAGAAGFQIGGWRPVENSRSERIEFQV